MPATQNKDDNLFRAKMRAEKMQDHLTAAIYTTGPDHAYHLRQVAHYRAELDRALKQIEGMNL